MRSDRRSDEDGKFVGVARRIRMPAFYLVTAGFLAFLVFALYESMSMLGTAWLGGYEWPTHRVHHVLIGGVLTLFGLTVAVQLYRPERRVGAMLLGIVIVATIAVVSVVESGIGALTELAVFVVPVALIALLHPARSELVRTFRSFDRRLLAVGVVGLVAFGALAFGEFGNHVTLTDDHVAFGHYLFVAFAALIIGLAAVVAAFRPAGWRALAYGAAFLAVVFAAASLAFPGAEQGSSLVTIGAIAAIAWAIALVGVSEYVDRDRTTESSDEMEREDMTSEDIVSEEQPA